MKRFLSNATTICFFLMLALSANMVFAGKGIVAGSGDQAVAPSGNWSLSAHPIWSADQKVNVTSVTSRRGADIVVARVEVENRGARAVTSVRLGWSIVEMVGAKNADFEVLATGSTPFLSLQGSHSRAVAKRDSVVIPAMSAVFFDRPIVGFGSFASDFFGADAEVNGSFRIYVSIEEVVYSDSKTELRPLNDLMIYESVRWSIGEDVDVDARPCPKQRCKINSGDAGLYYTCTSAASNTWCEVHDQGSSCTNHICTKTVEAEVVIAN